MINQSFNEIIEAEKSTSIEFSWKEKKTTDGIS